MKKYQLDLNKIASYRKKGIDQMIENYIKSFRAWTALMYQESAPDGWMEKLSNLLVEALISPLHDQDVWTVEDEVENTSHKAGEPKKAHWHIVVSYKNPTTYEIAKEVFDEIGAVMPPEPKAKVIYKNLSGIEKIGVERC